MYEDAQEIFDYLPVEAGSESRYIKQLWDAFTLLSEGTNDVPYFSIIPFHLLFMLAVQYKAYRLSAWDSQFFLDQINSNQCRTYGDENKQQLLNNIPLNKNLVWDTTQSSVKTLSLIKEKHIFNLFDIVGIDQDIKDSACALVDSRNDRLHANGEIDEEAENKINEYLKILRHLQEKCNAKSINIVIQGNWAEEIEEGMLSLDEFFQEKFLYSQFGKMDFGEVVGKMLASDNLDFDQWRQIVNKGLELTYDQAIEALRQISRNDLNGRRSDAVRILAENGEIEPDFDLVQIKEIELTDEEIDAAGETYVQSQIDANRGK